VITIELTISSILAANPVILICVSTVPTSLEISNKGNMKETSSLHLHFCLKTLQLLNLESQQILDLLHHLGYQIMGSANLGKVQ